MYLEERIEQVERQSETTARAVADLTVDVRAIRHDLTEGFKQVNARLDKVDGRLDSIDAHLDKVDGRLDRVDGRLDRIETDVSLIKQLIEVVLTRLPEK